MPCFFAVVFFGKGAAAAAGRGRDLATTGFFTSTFRRRLNEELIGRERGFVGFTVLSSPPPDESLCFRLSAIGSTTVFFAGFF